MLPLKVLDDSSQLASEGRDLRELTSNTTLFVIRCDLERLQLITEVGGGLDVDFIDKPVSGLARFKRSDRSQANCGVLQ